MAEAQRGARPLVTPLPAGARVLIVEARFYEALADEMAAGAAAELARNGAAVERIAVPGAFEIPGAIAMAADCGRYHGYIALGCVIRGDTSHYDYVCGESARGLMDLAVQRRLAIGYGILTVENEAQAWVRARRSEGDKGADAAHAALRMMSLRITHGSAS
ncbi:MAG: 6,7-dimethyl-8-ribityllumazine synthase [Rhodospirillales bacterium]|nr:MAG: 6,7-dimethyl-8-ribityllumazine synthase [Rhodospirillales bacterium]